MEQQNIQAYYANDIEVNRLEMEPFKLEGLRTKELIGRYLTMPNLQVLDVGGGAGYYSFWLQEQGHQVSLVDLAPRNIELAQQRAAASGVALGYAAVGDATRLDFPNEQFDVVLMLGPLYHLTNREDRLNALTEARRVLKPGGVLLAAVISRYASLFDGFQRDLVVDDAFYNILKNDLASGVHQNETGNLEYFTTAYFHTPKEIEEEIGEAGWRFETLIAIESFGWIAPNFGKKQHNPEYMEKLLSTIRLVERDNNLIAMSPHIMAVAYRD
jgi:ubiquinone/menaquinone biosynthesis C-methylase UbiE